ncbi:DUF6440 family protein [Sphingomonas sp. ACRSK]|uniref:DUF6440 family protein n=1 Tax=Sphingomonas sp. ACRSK TaxID=2918213 RepID=UPI001EF60B3B|nr:DUF6440 family protein [Sphingomonas sp. ACRSK]MCG7348957.1 DUF6440 family protein [Sphingomonas sp. ACRSK]
MKRDMMQAGRDVARGVMLEIARLALVWIGITILLALILSALGYGWDDTDDRGAGVHSQMALRTDHGTGCQYLETSGGGITPRLNADGKQVCR